MTSYQNCHRHFGYLTRETDIARKLLEKHGKASAQAVKELRGETDMPMGECADMLRCLWRDIELEHVQAENAKLREQIEHLQPTDCEGNVLDIADMVHMLRSEYDGDHEWDDVVVELVLTKWGGDRWIVRGSWGDAWACDCTKAGYDEDAYENFYDAEPFENPTLVEVENAKLRELAARAWRLFTENGAVHPSDLPKVDAVRDGLRELGVEVDA